MFRGRNRAENAIITGMIRPKGIDSVMKAFLPVGLLVVLFVGPAAADDHDNKSLYTIPDDLSRKLESDRFRSSGFKSVLDVMYKLNNKEGLINVFGHQFSGLDDYKSMLEKQPPKK